MSAWKLLLQSEYAAVWDSFEEQFDFKPHSNRFPGIQEPAGSIIYQFEYSSAENLDKAVNDPNSKGLAAFQKLVLPNEAVYAPDWQHDCYRFYPHLSFREWQIPILPDGDYSIFLAKDFSFGIFGHPWEQTICVWGDKLLAEFEKNRPLLFEKIIKQH